MGFTPLDGLVMATRSGSVDPGLVLWVQRNGGMDPESVERSLERESGLRGISGLSGDTRELQSAAEAGDEAAGLALDVYLHRLRASIAAMAAAMGGVDALAFTGGVGEGSAFVREGACEGLDFLGLTLDPGRNDAGDAFDRIISLPDAAEAILIVQAREDLEIAAQVSAVLAD